MHLFKVTYSNQTQASKSSRAPFPCWHSERSKMGGGGKPSLKKQTYKSVLFLCSAEWEALTKSAQNLPPQDGPTKLVLRFLHSLIGLKKERRVDLLVEAFRLWVSLSVCLKVVTNHCVDKLPGFRGGLCVADHTPSLPGLIQPVLWRGHKMNSHHFLFCNSAEEYRMPLNWKVRGSAVQGQTWSLPPDSLVHSQALPHTCCVTLDNLLSVTVPQSHSVKWS